ncbi:hypothetical protein CB1_009538003 [Camelus ferus]|nr:hypothetical protein CB1_009538003 [Camelus ferus]
MTHWEEPGLWCCLEYLHAINETFDFRLYCYTYFRIGLGLNEVACSLRLSSLKQGTCAAQRRHASCSSEGFVTSALSHLLRSLQRSQGSAMLLLLIPVLEMGFALTQPPHASCSSEVSVTSALSHLLRSLQRFQRSAMLLLLIPVLEMGFALRGAGAQSVTQPEDHVSVFARAPVQVKCNYSYSGSPALFWYVQYPKQSSSGSPELFWVSSQQGEQNLPALIVQEGENAILHCSYSTALSSSHWYRQDPRRGFTHLILTRSNEKEKPSGRLRATLCTSVRSSSLLITASQAADTATYLCATGGTSGDTVTQTEDPVILPEGAFLTLNCTYETSYSAFLFWYVQYLNKEPELLLKSSSENQKVVRGGFQATLVKSSRTFHLQKPSVQTSDSAVYYCALRDTVRGAAGGAEHKPRGAGGTSGDSVTQTEVPVTLSERELLMLNCTYQTTDSDPYLFWYVQYVNKAPQLLLKGSTANPRPEHQGFQATLVKSNRTFHLQKPSVQMSDSAVYYCALRDTVRGAAGGAEHKPRGAGGTSGDSVTQTEVPVTLPEEALLILNCTYQSTGSDPYLLWYVQYVNRAPQLLLKGSAANPRPEHQGFQATLVKSNRTFHLQKPSVQTSDSAVYYCALRDTVRGAAGGAEHKPRGAGGTSGDSVTQTEVPVTLPEEALLILNCTYQSTGSDPYLLWYVQYVNRAPQLLLKGSTANPRPEHQGFQATLVKSSRTFHLQKP